MCLRKVNSLISLSTSSLKMSYWLWLAKHQLEYKELHSTELTKSHTHTHTPPPCRLCSILANSQSPSWPALSKGEVLPLGALCVNRAAVHRNVFPMQVMNDNWVKKASTPEKSYLGLTVRMQNVCWCYWSNTVNCEVHADYQALCVWLISLKDKILGNKANKWDFFLLHSDKTWIGQS